MQKRHFDFIAKVLNDALDDAVECVIGRRFIKTATRRRRRMTGNWPKEPTMNEVLAMDFFYHGTDKLAAIILKKLGQQRFDKLFRCELKEKADFLLWAMITLNPIPEAAVKILRAYNQHDQGFLKK